MKSVFQIVSDERTLGKQHKKLKSRLKDRLQRKKKIYVDVSAELNVVLGVYHKDNEVLVVKYKKRAKTLNIDDARRQASNQPL